MYAPRALVMCLLAITLARQAEASDTVAKRQKAACTGLLSGNVSPPAVEFNVRVFVAGDTVVQYSSSSTYCSTSNWSGSRKIVL